MDDMTAQQDAYRRSVEQRFQMLRVQLSAKDVEHIEDLLAEEDAAMMADTYMDRVTTSSQRTA